MPLISTLGAASAKIFGFTRSITNNWFGRLKGTSQTSYGTGVALDSSKNMYISGSNNSTGQVAKYNELGVIQSQSSVVSSDANKTVGVAVDSSNNVYYVNRWADSTYINISVNKYNSSGTLQWTRRFVNISIDRDAYITAITTDSSNNVYISGYWLNSSSYNVVIIKINSSGTTQWQQRLTSGSPNYFINTQGNIAVDSSGNVYFSGLSWITTSGPPGQEILLVKLNSSGALVWQRTLGDSSTQQGWGTGIDSDGNVYVTGRSGFYQIIAKFNSSGTLQWNRSLYNGGNAIQVTNLIVDTSGNSYICGYYTIGSGSPDLENAFIAKYNSSGTIQWQRRFGTDIIDSRNTSTQANNLAFDASGTLYMIGQSNANTSVYQDNFFFAKLPPDGSKTGTYTLSGVTYYYSATSFTDSDGGLTSATPGYTMASNTWSEDTTNLTETTSSLVSTVTTF